MAEWKRIKFATCPKCQRICSVAGSESMEGNDWKPMNNAETLNNQNERYVVECPGCGVHFIADISQAIPCWEEKR